VVPYDLGWMHDSPRRCHCTRFKKELKRNVLMIEGTRILKVLQSEGGIMYGGMGVEPYVKAKERWRGTSFN